jgi:hypothetical protein
MSTLVFVLVFMIGVPLGWEVYAIADPEVRTISRVWAELGREWNPLFCYALSVLNGHFFLRPDENVAKYLGEPMEVGIVLGIAWVVFYFFRRNPEMTPLPTWAGVALIAFGVFVGAFAWTIEP